MNVRTHHRLIPALLVGVGAATALAPATLRADEADIGVRIVDGRFRTAQWDHTDRVMGGDARVFGGELAFFAASGALPASVFGDEPGWGAAPGTFMSDGTLTFTARSALRYFDGADLTAILFTATTTRLRLANNLDPRPAGESDFILSPLTDPGDPSAFDPTRSFTINVGPSFPGGEPLGGFHRHLWYDLLAQSGDAEDVAEGFYLIEFDITGSAAERSLPFWIVFKYGESFSESDHEAVIDWVYENIVPTPGAGGLMLLAGVIASRRRRR
jgi:hypothetical protein